MKQPQREDAAHPVGRDQWRLQASLDQVVGSAKLHSSRATTMVSWIRAAEQLGITVTRLHDGVLTGEFPAAAPSAEDAFTVSNVLDIDAIERLRRASEDATATASDLAGSLGE